MKPRILIVDDEPGVRTALVGRPARRGLPGGRRRERRGVPRPRDARRPSTSSCSTSGCPGSTGSRRWRGCASGRSTPQVVMISGHGNIESAVRAIKLGAFDFIEKPLSLEKTVLVVAQRAAAAPPRGREPRAARARGPPPDDGGRELRHAPAARAGGDGGAHQRPRADLRRERHRQGAGGAHRPRAEPPPRGPVRRGELRGDPRGADRERAVRPRAGRVHRRGGRPPGQVRAGRRRARSSSTRSAT